ncbi:hypothetical protein L915_16066 [Phytophthora nicotianae]|uniref:Uncharacterized protein n=1 Tax=Phytophthora nicotianae TaxID=4792 RepID=W2G431_PHYNI|nr:hypothetical protein L915_16066 [Phytophthora nicotianae]
MKNPEWNRKIGDLGVAIGEKLGFQDVLLDIILSKLVVYAPGAHIKKQKDGEEQKDVVASLVVQLSSLHEGGNLVVFDDEDTTQKYRFDFGKSTRKAAFNPSYAVYVAGAEYELEEVQKGYRVVLEYSIRLPSGETVAPVNQSRRFLQRELKEAIEDFGQTNGTFALLLANDNGPDERFEMEGSQRMIGVDRARFQALQKANSFVSDDKKVKFYIARIEHTAKVVKDLGGDDNSALYRSYPRIPLRGIGAEESRWKLRRRSESVMWFTTIGKMLQQRDLEYPNDTLGWTSTMNFLNPDRTSSRSTWGKYVSRDELVVVTTIKYKAYAVVWWHFAHDLRNTAHLFGEDAALSLIITDKHVNASKMRSFLNIATGNEENDGDQNDSISPLHDVLPTYVQGSCCSWGCGVGVAIFYPIL